MNVASASTNCATYSWSLVTLLSVGDQPKKEYVLPSLRFLVGVAPLNSGTALYSTLVSVSKTVPS